MAAQVHVSKPTDLEFKAMVGGLGVFGVITEVLMQVRSWGGVQAAGVCCGGVGGGGGVGGMQGARCPLPR
jgi:hypothetical protein